MKYVEYIEAIDAGENKCISEGGTHTIRIQNQSCSVLGIRGNRNLCCLPSSKVLSIVRYCNTAGTYCKQRNDVGSSFGERLYQE